MSGSVDLNIDLMDWLLDVMNAAALKTVDCKDVNYDNCSPTGGAPSCTPYEM